MILVPEIRDPVVLVGAAQVTLTNAIIDYDVDKHDYDIRRSVINGYGHIVSRGDFFTGRIDWHGITLSQYIAFKALQGTTVRLWPFGVGGISGSSPAQYYPFVDVIVNSVAPYHRNSVWVYDALIISVVSQAKYTLARALNTGLAPET